MATVARRKVRMTRRAPQEGNLSIPVACGVEWFDVCLQALIITLSNPGSHQQSECGSGDESSSVSSNPTMYFKHRDEKSMVKSMVCNTVPDGGQRAKTYEPQVAEENKKTEWNQGQRARSEESVALLSKRMKLFFAMMS